MPNLNISPKECAFALMTFPDINFAECLAYAAKMKSKGINGAGGFDFPENMSLTQDDMDNFDLGFMDWLKECQSDILFGDNNESAWWKDNKQKGEDDERYHY